MLKLKFVLHIGAASLYRCCFVFHMDLCLFFCCAEMLLDLLFSSFFSWYQCRIQFILLPLCVKSLAGLIEDFGRHECPPCSGSLETQGRLGLPRTPSPPVRTGVSRYRSAVVPLCNHSAIVMCHTCQVLPS
jgi:hypothetical protein